MKRFVWIGLGVLGLIGIALWQHDRIPVLRQLFHGEEAATQYVCPMHPNVVSDRPGRCPICGMELKEVKKPKGGGHKHPPGSFQVSPERRQLIGVKSAKAGRKNLWVELRLPGRVAFDQELYVAETEYVAALLSGASDVLPVIAKKLIRLGISPQELASLQKTRKVDEALFLPKEGGTFWVYASVYEAELSRVGPGMSVLVQLPSDASVQWTGEIKQVEPVIDPVTRTTQARILILPSPLGGEGRERGVVKPETYVDVILKKELGERLAIPADAVLDTGLRQVVFVDLGEGYLEPREVTVGERAGSDFAVIAGLQAGETVITSAQFLLDSEAQIQSALQQFGAQSGGHQH